MAQHVQRCKTQVQMRSPMTTEISAHVTRILSYCEDGEGSHLVGPETNSWRSPHASWRRCVKLWGLNPTSSQRLTRLDDAEVKRHIRGVEAELDLIAPELDSLFQVVRELGYSVGFADRTGVIVRYRHNEDARDLSGLGEIFSEQMRGTNSLGTCLVERRPTATFRGDHFLTEMMHLSCASAPIYVNDELFGAIDLSTSNPVINEGVHKIAYNLTKSIGKKCDNILLRSLFPAALAVSFEVSNGDEAVLTFSEEGALLASNLAARSMLLQLGKPPSDQSLWSIFDSQHVEVSERGSGRAIAEMRFSGSVVHVLARLEGTALPYVLRDGFVYAGTLRNASLGNRGALDDLAGSDRRAMESADTLRRVRETDIPILLLGETGVGKVSWAHAVHDSSARRRAPFEVVDCANDLAGIRNYDLKRQPLGFSRLLDPIARACANGGTLFLERVDELTLAQQSQLVQFLGGFHALSEDACARGFPLPRVMATARPELRERVLNGEFRRDLFFRLAGIEVRLPALREREDFEQVACSILRVAGKDRQLGISVTAMQALRQYTWPGNVRELRNVLRRAVSLASPEDILLPKHLHLPVASSISIGKPTPTVDEAKERVENEYIDRRLEEFGGNITLVAKSLGISRTTLYRKLARRKGVQKT
jgi:sigma-54 dependent transcriptional regulator, acetoin dehydrogenase operon transcriptional activator AcoR